MSSRALLVVSGTFVLGCASAGTSGEGRAVALPVYATAAEVPCRYELIRTIQGELTANTVADLREMQRRQRDELATEGARLGADAVLLDRSGGNTVTATGVADQTGRFTTPMNVPYSGDAIRFVVGTCRDGR